MFKRLRQPFFEADIGASGGDTPVGGNDSASSNSEPAFTPAWGLPNEGGNQAAGQNPLFAQEPVPPATQEPTAPAPDQSGQVFDFAGRKIEVADPSIAAALKDVHKDYSALQGTFTQTSQRMKELEQANQTYLNLLQNVQPGQQGQPTANDQQQAQPTEEDLEKIKSDFMDKFYDNPMQAIEGMLDSMFQQKVQPIIEPISQERQWNEQVQGLQQKYPDFQTMIGPMQELLQEMPELAQHGLEGIYHLTKRSQPAPQPTPEQLLNDTNFRQQIMSNPDIQKQFLSQYLQDKQGTQQQAPTMMGGQPGGQIPAGNEQRPNNIKDATKAFRRHLGLS